MPKASSKILKASSTSNALAEEIPLPSKLLPDVLYVITPFFAYVPVFVRLNFLGLLLKSLQNPDLKYVASVTLEPAAPADIFSSL
ncbi:hypothetical protein [Synechococcus sp. CC9616]|uniref:hypothetical protein n=1 Tax=Synechococcus sp. CC9616 TaxID=110663 RepID=UPI0018DBCBE2|nr:hypothetical protein [Synechococcus sp. CC9616]